MYSFNYLDFYCCCLCSYSFNVTSCPNPIALEFTLIFSRFNSSVIFFNRNISSSWILSLVFISLNALYSITLDSNKLVSDLFNNGDYRVVYFYNLLLKSLMVLSFYLTVSSVVYTLRDDNL